MMKYLIPFILAIAFFTIYYTKKDDEAILNDKITLYDSTLAIELGADDYGMKKYVFAFLKKGPNRTIDKEKAQKLQLAHLKNIERLANEGKLVLAGPFLNDGDLRGIYIFNVATIKEAKELTESDPAIQAGSLQMELVEWYGSAALLKVNEIHRTIAKTNPSEN